MLDEGEGFDPQEVADPLAPENILKSSGRGIFFMRSFMDDVTLRRGAEGGWRCAWSRSWRPVPDPLPPVYLATAVEAVIRAGEAQMARFGGDLRIDKKGAIDLVTEMDLAIERAFRAMIAERFPDHAVLGEEFEESGDRDARPRFCWVLDPIDGTTNYAHGLPIFCASLALEIDGVAVVGAIYDPNRRELFTAEKGHGAWLNGAPLRVSSARQPARLAAGHRLSLRHPSRFVGAHRALRRVHLSRARGAPTRLGRARPLLRGGGTLRRVLGAQASALGRRRRCADRRRRPAGA